MTEKEAIIKRLTKFMYAERVELYSGLFDDLNECVKTLEKQIAKKPIEDNTSYSGYKCPACNSNTYQLRSHNICKTPNCIFCGQKLDWGNEDDRD